MKKTLLTYIILIFACIGAFARQGKDLERIHAAKIAYITDRLHLTTEQATQFIPVYNEFESEKKDCRKKFLGKYKGMDKDGADDATSKQFIDDNLDFQAEVIQIRRRYNDRFLKILSAGQLAELGPAEREFTQLLMQRLRKERHDNGGGHWR